MIGNTILVKPASIVPQFRIIIKELFKEANATAGVCTNLLIPKSKATVLEKDERIKGVSLTGSEATGWNLAKETGKYFKKSVLELTG